MKIKIYYFVLLGLIAFLAVFFLTRYLMSDKYGKRIESTKISLFYLRTKINNHKDETGKYPESLLTLKDYYEKDLRKEYRNENKEYISSEIGSDLESEKLDNEGGWFYNKNTGELKVNLDKQLGTYFKNYYKSNRNDKPCDW